MTPADLKRMAREWLARHPVKLGAGPANPVESLLVLLQSVADAVRKETIEECAKECGIAVTEAEKAGAELAALRDVALLVRRFEAALVVPYDDSCLPLHVLQFIKESRAALARWEATRQAASSGSGSST